MRHARLTTTVTAILFCTSLSLATDGPPIHAAARTGNLERVVELLDAAPELVHARTPIGQTPLHMAATSDSRGLIEALLAAGANVNAADDRGETPLHLAARRFKADALRALIAAGADVNARNLAGQTPLHVLGSAARVRDGAFQRLIDALEGVLIEAGADPTLLDHDGRPAGGPREPFEPTPARGNYRTYDDITQIMHDRATQYPDICQLHDLGLSYLGRHLWALNITDNPGVDEDESEFKYVSTMHGDEWVGNEMCLFLIDHLLTGYGSDPEITNLVDEIDIWIVPLMNPDGYVANTRRNAQNIDLNRDFPEWVNGDPNTPDGRATETQVIMNWTFAESFTCSANLHTGALVVNYPFDNDGQGSIYSPTPDEDMFVYISEEYSQYNLPMWNSPSFYHGITNGAAWYSIDGGMQDWHYRYMGDNEVTLELSNVKRPPYSQIPTFWEQNRESMLAYMASCLIGVRGIVTDVHTGLPLAATVTVVDRDHEIYTDPDVGDYHRMLMAGSYELHFEADGYEPLTLPVTVSSGPATRLDVLMIPTLQPGDLNCDGVLNAFDIDPFVLALTDPAGYAAAWPNCFRYLADINGDGEVNAFDIDPFVELLIGG